MKHTLFLLTFAVLETAGSVGRTQAQLARLDSARALSARADTAAESATSKGLQLSRSLRLLAAQLFAESGDPALQSEQLVHAGVAAFRMGEADSALVLYRRVLDMDVRSRSIEPLLFRMLGSAHGHLAQPDSAIEYLRRAVSTAAEQGNPLQGGRAWNDLGGLLLERGQIEPALDALREALAAARAVRDRGDEATVMNSLGIAFRREAQFDSALAYYTAAAAIAGEIGERWGQNVLLNNLASVYWAIGRHDTALVVNRAALEGRRAVGDAAGEAQTLNNIGTIWMDMGVPDSARIFYREALRVRQRLNDKEGISNSLQNLGNLYLNVGVLDSAEYYLREALTLSRAHANPRREALTLHDLGLIAARRGDAATAAGRTHEALSIRRVVRDRTGVAQSLLSLASIHHRIDPSPDLAKAAAYYDSAAAVFSEVGMAAGDDPNRVSLAESTVELYRGWVLASLARNAELGEAQASLVALAVADRGRAQGLLDLLRGEATSPFRAGADLVREGEQLVTAVSRGDLALLMYVATKDTLVAFFAGPDRELTVLTQPIGADTLARWVRTFRSALGVDAAAAAMTQRGSALESHSPGLGGIGTLTEQAERLSQVLLPAPLRARMRGVREVVVVPHGPLGLVPFAALPGAVRDTSNPPVAFRYSPSIATLAELQSRSAAVSVARIELRNALVIGNPVMPEVSAADRTRQALAPLPGSAMEAFAVASALGVAARTGPDATESVVRALLPEAPLVHLATHGFAYSGVERARQSFIALAPDSIADGRLTVAEVLDDPALDLAAELVVLSACQTGLGNLRNAEGTVGLQRAFLARGARSVLVSMWSVSDDATTALMAAFYRHWRHDPDLPGKAEALRRAQEDVRRTPEWEHPRFWSAFQLVGAS